MTPLRALAEELEQAPGDVVLLHRIRREAEALFTAELQRLFRQRGMRVQTLVGPRPTGTAAFLPASLAGQGDATGLRRLVPDVAERDVFVCGPDAWMDAAVAAVRGAGVPEERVHLERFSW